ncbi:MAG: 50S ribosomal protein L32 [Egibacteraceae bacterium]
MRAPLPASASCARCKAPLRPHTVCGVCGHYGGRQVIAVED